MADREDYEKWVAEYEKPSGPDRWVDPWTWAKAMKDMLEQLDDLKSEMELEIAHCRDLEKELEDVYRELRDRT